MGHTVGTAGKLKEALKNCRRPNVMSLVTDIGLPDGDGWELLKKVRLPRPIYAIAMSGFGLKADQARSAAAGFRHHLLKPFDPDALDKLLEEAARERNVRPSGSEVVK